MKSISGSCSWFSILIFNASICAFTELSVAITQDYKSVISTPIFGIGQGHQHWRYEVIKEVDAEGSAVVATLGEELLPYFCCCVG